MILRSGYAMGMPTLPPMKHLRLLASLPVVLLAAGCATTGAPDVPPAYLSVLQQKQVDPGTYTRISKGLVLTYGDVLDLVQKGIPGDKIVSYMKATRAPYNFSRAQINGLIKAGADDALVNFLGARAGVYMQDQANAPRGPVPAPVPNPLLADPYFGDPYYAGPAPFDFGYPDDWVGPVNTAPRGGGGRR